MKREQKSLTNKGFSLVELIIVVAIMAVLIGVLAPQYLRYVEKARLQKDNSAIAEVANVIKIAGAEEAIVEYLQGSGAGSTVTAKYIFDSTGMKKDGGAKLDDASATVLDKEITATINPDDVKITSTTYATGAPTLIVTIDPATSIISVKADGWIEKPGADALTEEKGNAKKF